MGMSVGDDFSTANLHLHVTFLASGTVLNNRYVIDRVLGSGGMGNVYLANAVNIPGGRRCAIKETPTPADDPPTPQQKARIRGLKMEADIMSKLDHPAIPRIFDFFECNRRHYLVMEHIEGETLNDRLRRQLQEQGIGFEESIVIDWMIKLCDLFDYLHNQEQPVIYRDTKPDNLIVTPEGDLKLIDFGIARRLINKEMHLTELGTQGYAAPEAYYGYGDERTDIYSLGAMMHALLTGLDPQTVPLFDWTNHRPRKYRSGLSQSIDEIIMRCLKKDINERWPSARELRYALLTCKQSSGKSFLTSNQHKSHPLTVPAPLPNEPMIGHKRLTTDVIMRPEYALAPDIVWVFEAQGAVRSSPIVSNGQVYFGSHDANLYALRLSDGKLEGAFATQGYICSDPIVTDRAVYFGSEDGQVYAVDRALKRKLWAYPTGKPIVSSPAVLGDLLIIGNDGGNVFAFPLMGREPAWDFETWGPVRGALAAIDGVVVFGSHDQRIYALDSKGARKWWRTTRDKVDAMAINYQNLILIGGVDRYVYAMEKETGVPVWRRQLDGCVLTAVALGERCIYVGSSDGRISCMDLRTGDTKWRYNVRSQITSDLVLRDQRLYFGCADGGMYCFDVQRQEILWRHLAEGPIVTRPTLVDDLVIIGSVDHRVYALRDASAK